MKEDESQGAPAADADADEPLVTSGLGGGAPAAASSVSPTASASDIEEQELCLLDLLHAPIGSFLYHLAEVMTRIENLSHVLAWARFDEKANLLDPTALSHADLLVVTLPRLKLTFQVAVPPARPTARTPLVHRAHSYTAPSCLSCPPSSYYPFLSLSHPQARRVGTVVRLVILSATRRGCQRLRE